MLSTIPEIVDDLYRHLIPNKRLFLKGFPYDDLIDLQCSFGKAIRIRYNLTSTNPLVREWFTNPENHIIIDGVDVSDNHPYNVSLQIMQEIWKKINVESY